LVLHTKDSYTEGEISVKAVNNLLTVKNERLIILV
jgi:hypothetical protein